MSKEYVYPTKEAILTVNEVVNIMSNRKADQHKLLKPSSFIDGVIEKTRQTNGNLYDKAGFLLHSLVTTHGFASGNKRTGFITAIWFLKKNGGKLKVKSFNKAERIITNIRVFEPTEIAMWLRTGVIDETKIEH